MALSSFDDPRRHVGVHAERLSNMPNTDFPGYYPGEDHSWNLDWFTKNLIVKVQRLSARSCEFDIVGVDASVANALRRIIIAEVPTIAIEHVYMWNNTSVLHDEVLAHRLGLVPLNVDPSLIEMKTADDVATDRNTIVFRLQVACTRNIAAVKGVTDPENFYHNSQVLTSGLKWQPQGEQESIFSDKPPKPTNTNILLTKLRPGQEVDIEVHAIKGIGATHAKWSPVATASYRLHPHIHVKSAIPPELVPKFASCFSPGVIGTIKKGGKAVAVVVEPRKDAMSREVLRHKEFQDKVVLSRIRDWFIFNVECEGSYAPERLLIEAVAVMRDKIAVVRKAVVALDTVGNDGDVDMG